MSQPQSDSGTDDANSELHSVLNQADQGDIIDIKFDGGGGGVFRVDEFVDEFGGGGVLGRIVCRNEHDEITTVIRERHREDDEVAIERGDSRSDASPTTTGVTAEIVE